MTGKPDETIWFDGVDRKLIETHSEAPTLVEGNKQSLITKTPLTSFVSYGRDKATNKASTNSKEDKKSNNHRSINSRINTIKPRTGITDEVAMDCEMVECFHHKSVLARVSIVNLFGHTILDKYVAPPSRVTDYRTRYSGIRRKDLIEAPEFETVQQEVAEIIKGRIVVGHALHNDFGVLKIDHPPDKIRDTSQYFKYLFQGKTPSLKKLSESILGIKIQKGEHDSVIDAQATMKLYVKERDKWNEKLLKEQHRSNVSKTNQKLKKQKTKPKKKKVKTFYVLTT